jgi:ATP-dependent Clp protease ATP-binding subunit ClpB
MTAADRVGRFPNWLQEIDGALPVRAQFVLTGNIRDDHLVDGVALPAGTIETLWEGLQPSGYECLLVHDRVDYLRVYPPTPEAEAAAHATAGQRPTGEVTLDRLADVIASVALNKEHRVAVVLDYASRLALDLRHPSEEEHSFLVACEKLSHTATALWRPGTRGAPLFNPVFWLVDSERDLPAWFLLGNDAVRTISLPMPDLDDRGTLAERLVPSLAGAAGAPPDVVRAATRRFAEQTEAMSLRSMLKISSLSVDRGTDIGDVEDAVRCYRVGMLDNPWKRPMLRDRIREAEKLLQKRVLGQNQAARRVRDVLIRSTTGLTAAHSSGSVARPRGILFFAGPTGVGKTELAKAVTELVFGDERAYTRFDMSEFSAEHSEARLIGAPPGYTGHDAGGELTNAVRDRPFSLILFDEIEKAHPQILDKFLQILEDGRLTDGSGNTVYFSESILVFTSNLGIYVKDRHGNRVPNVSPDTPQDEVEQRVRQAITDHFVLEINRPELLNRIGDNIVIFDFITREVGIKLVDLFLRNIFARVQKEMGIELDISDPALEALRTGATSDLAFGGRGISATLETMFVNPLARALFDAGPAEGETMTVVSVSGEGAGGWTVQLR